MSKQSDEMQRELEEIFDTFPHIHTADIPGIDLYMDQVTTFLQENLRGLSRDPDGDKFLTKTMINNYVKNDLFPSPVRKRYSRAHLYILIFKIVFQQLIAVNGKDVLPILVVDDEFI